MKFKAPSEIRPTTNKVRMAIFNILRSEWGSLERKTCLDLFSGSGALGLSALEEGAASLICIDSSFASCQAIEENAQKLHLDDQVQVVKSDVFKFKTDKSFDLIFADPPYKIESKNVKKLLEICSNLLAENGLLVLELKANSIFDYGDLDLILSRAYGDSKIWLFKVRH